MDFIDTWLFLLGSCRSIYYCYWQFVVLVVAEKIFNQLWQIYFVASIPVFYQLFKNNPTAYS